MTYDPTTFETLRLENAALRRRVSELEHELLSARSTHSAFDGSLQRMVDIFRQAPVAICVLRGPDHIFELANETLHALVGSRDVRGRSIRDVFPDLTGQGFSQTLDEVYATDAPWYGQDILFKLDRSGTGQSEDAWLNIMCQPTHSAADQVDGLVLIIADMTSQVLSRRETEQLNDTLHTFRSLVEHALDGILLVDMQGGITYANLAAARMNGCEQSALVGQPVTAFALPDDLEALTADVRHHLDESGSWAGTVRAQRPDGTRWLSYTSLFILKDISGNPTAMASISRDITAQVEQEQELRRREKHLRSLATNLPDVIYIFDVAQDQAVYLNRDVFLGYTRDELLGPGSLMANVVHEDALVLQHHWQQAVHGIVVPPIEFRMRSKHGAWEWVQMRVTVLERQPDGSPLQLLVTLSLITKRRQIEEELRVSEERLRAVVSNVPVILFALDHEGNIVLSEGKGLTAFAYETGELVGRSVFDLYAHDPQALARFRQALAGEEVTWEHVYADRILELHLSPTRSALGHLTGVIGVEFDTTARKKAEEERLMIERRLQETQRMESLGMLAGGIAHDFNNLLVAVLGNADLALLDIPTDSPARPVVEQIGVAARRAADLTRQLLAYTGKGRFLVEAVNLNLLIEEMTHLLRATIGTDVALHYNLTAHLPPIEVDATQIRQVIMNLVINASEAIGNRSGIITITTNVATLDHDYILDMHLDSGMCEGRYVYLEISDTGCGMDSTTRTRIFEPFFTTKFTGRGLGLAAVQGIVRGHRGAVKVYSEPGYGSSFKLLFPVAGGSVIPPDTIDPVPTWQGTGTVLLIDDDADVRAVGTRMLERLGFSVLTAADGLGGVDIFRDQADSIIGVLLDLTMPNLNGEVVFRMLRQVQPDVPVVLMSGYNEQIAIGQFAGKGLAGFLQKPFTPDDLRAVLQRAF